MKLKCPKCQSENYRKNGTNHFGEQRYCCTECGKRFLERTAYGMPLYYAKHPTETPELESDKGEDTIINRRKTRDSWEENNHNAVGSIVTAVKPNTIEDAVELFKVDLKIWEAERMVVNSWDVTMKTGTKSDNVIVTKTNYQVKVWFRKRIQEITPEELAEQFLEHLGEYKTPLIKSFKFKKPKEDLLLEITNFDLHLGKLCWKAETGENFDIKIAKQRFDYGIEDLLNKAKPFGHSKCVFAVGNDFFQADTPDNQTTAGTQVDSDVRWQKRFDVGNELLVGGIDRLRSTSPVDVVCIRGNHDWMTMYMAGQYLKAWFRNDKNVNIINTPMPRQYYFWKDVLLGYTHSHKEKPVDLFALMANEAKQYWSKATTKEWHNGHLHHEITKDFKGVVVRNLKSQTGTDAWHFGKGYTGSVKGSEAFLFKPKEGMIANFHSNVIL